MNDLYTRIALSLGANAVDASSEDARTTRARTAATDGRAPREVFYTMMRDYFGIAYPLTDAGTSTSMETQVFTEILLEALEDAYETGFSDGERRTAMAQGAGA